jgi:hypothetical protein
MKTPARTQDQQYIDANRNEQDHSQQSLPQTSIIVSVSCVYRCDSTSEYQIKEQWTSRGT